MESIYLKFLLSLALLFLLSFPAIQSESQMRFCDGDKQFKIDVSDCSHGVNFGKRKPDCVCISGVYRSWTEDCELYDGFINEFCSPITGEAYNTMGIRLIRGINDVYKDTAAVFGKDSSDYQTWKAHLVGSAEAKTRSDSFYTLNGYPVMLSKEGEEKIACIEPQLRVGQQVCRFFSTENRAVWGTNEEIKVKVMSSCDTAKVGELSGFTVGHLKEHRCYDIMGRNVSECSLSCEGGPEVGIPDSPDGSSEKEPGGEGEETTDPSVEDTTPDGGDSMPGGEDTTPGGVDPMPGGGVTKPGEGEHKPGGGVTKPGEGEHKPGEGVTMPGEGEHKPGGGVTKPGEGEHKPGGGVTTPGGENNPGEGDPNPGEGDPNPGEGDPNPGEGDPNPGEGENNTGGEGTGEGGESGGGGGGESMPGGSPGVDTRPVNNGNFDLHKKLNTYSKMRQVGLLPKPDLSMTAPNRTFSLLDIAKRVVQGACPSRFVSDVFLNQAVELFVLLHRGQDFRFIEDIERRDFKWIEEILLNCRVAMIEKSLDVVGNPYSPECDEDGLIQRSCTKDIDVRICDDLEGGKYHTFGKYHYIVEAVWNIIDMTHAVCYPYFQKSYRMFHVWEQASEKLLTRDIRNLWYKPNVDLRVYDALLSQKSMIDMINLERCTEAAYSRTVLPRLKRPPKSKTHFRRKRAVTSSLPSVSESVDVYCAKKEKDFVYSC